MPRTRVQIIVAISVMLSALVAAAPADAACNARSDGANLCPFRVGDNNVLDRCLGAPLAGPDAGKPTALGNSVCDAIKHFNAVQANLGRSAGAMVDQTKRDVDQFVQVTMKGAYNPQSIATYNRVARYPNQLAKDIDGVLKDPTCGSPGALRALKVWFDQQAQNLGAVGRIAQDVGQAITALGPAVPEALKISGEAGKLAVAAGNAGIRAKQELDALKKAADTIHSDLDQLANLDVAGTVATGADLAVSVGPFLGSCGACVDSLAGGASSLAAGGTATTAGTGSCPESAGGGCVVAVAGVPVGTIGPVIAGAVATPACTAAGNGALNIVDYVQKIDKFIKTTIKLANSLKSSIDNSVRAGQALATLVQDLGKEAQPSLATIQASLNRMADATDQSFDIMSRNVAPATGRLAANLLSQMSQNVNLMYRCYQAYQDLAFKMGGDTVKAMAELTVATALLVDGGKIADNVYKQSIRAVKAAQDEASARWQKLHGRDMQLYEELWGVPAYQVDFGKTAAYLVTLNLQRVQKIVGDATDLDQDRLGAINAALDAGKRAFLDEDKLRAARTKFDEAGVRAANAERLFQSNERAVKPTLRSLPTFPTPILQADVHRVIGQQKVKRLQIVR
jgi:hypothetical protein